MKAKPTKAVREAAEFVRRAVAFKQTRTDKHPGNLPERGVVRGKGGDRKSKATVALDSLSDIAAELGDVEDVR